MHGDWGYNFLVLKLSSDKGKCSFFPTHLFQSHLSTGIYKQYKAYFTVPYFIFLRDTLSFLALLGMHFAICVEPSQLSFSRLEWGILVFLFGRLLIEIKQIVDVARFEGKKMKRKALWSYLRYIWHYFRKRHPHQRK